MTCGPNISVPVYVTTFARMSRDWNDLIRCGCYLQMLHAKQHQGWSVILISADVCRWRSIILCPPNTPTCVPRHPPSSPHNSRRRSGGKTLCMQNRRAAYMRVRGESCVCLCVFVCDGSTFWSLWIFTKALWNCAPISHQDLMPASLLKEQTGQLKYANSVALNARF